MKCNQLQVLETQETDKVEVQGLVEERLPVEEKTVKNQDQGSKTKLDSKVDKTHFTREYLKEDSQISLLQTTQ